VKSILRIALWSIAILLFFVMVLPFLVPAFFRSVGTILFGWLEFLKRVAPQVSLSWSGIGMVVLCSVLIVAGLNSLGRWLTRSSPDNPRWRWSWSVSIYTVLWLLFLAAMGVTGFVHQVAWLARSKEPWTIESTKRERVQLQWGATEILMSAQASAWDIRATQDSFFGSERLLRNPNKVLQEELQVVFVPDSSNRLAAAVIFFRDPNKRDRSGLIVVNRSGQKWYPPTGKDEVRALLAQNMTSP
jgi:hypothetical protein